jgi:hypothetical protein
MRHDQPPVKALNHGRPPDDIDGLLRTFLRAEMPDPWPVMKFPAPAKTLPLTPPRRWQALNSRFALAATVAFCLVGSMSLASIFSTDDLPGKTFKGGESALRPVVTVFEVTRNGKKMKGSVQENGKKVFIKVEQVSPVDVEEAGSSPEDE